MLVPWSENDEYLFERARDEATKKLNKMGFSSLAFELTVDSVVKVKKFQELSMDMKKMAAYFKEDCEISYLIERKELFDTLETEWGNVLKVGNTLINYAGEKKWEIQWKNISKRSKSKYSLQERIEGSLRLLKEFGCAEEELTAVRLKLLFDPLSAEKELINLRKKEMLSIVPESNRLANILGEIVAEIMEETAKKLPTN